GIAGWHGAEGNYWGHNALIRTRAFAEQAGLPVLRGRSPFGGHIMSHDFVEAALIRRGGWSVHMVPGLRGSYESAPASLIDLAVRDRRWCQGNLQHAAVLPARGLAWTSRLHLLTGIGSYITAPLWLLFLLTGILIALQAHFVSHDYFPGGKSLFPTWPIIDPVRAMWMFIGTMAVLLAPKLLAAIAVLLRAGEGRGHGGAARLLMSVAAETILTGLIAPMTMLSQSGAVCEVLLGRDSGWQPQRRDDGSVPIGELARRYRHHTLLGLLLGGGAWIVSPYLALWMTPVVLGLVLAIPLAAVTGQRRAGWALRGIGLFCTPEETAPPSVVGRASELVRQLEHDADSDALARLLDDPDLLAAHAAMLPPSRRPRIDPVDATLLVARIKLDEARSLNEVWGGLTRAERLAVLMDEPALERLVALSSH
ncbi:MAG: glucans biosynthesis glucosyltransferase MdoH, partial [Bradyrhizobium sp.]